jgi:DNA-binding transcriptional ArsR family regulator
MPVAEVFKALGEPTRLKMVERLSHKGPHTITSLCEDLTITRQGARKHLQILADSHIITLSQDGRKTNVELDPHTLEKGKKFIIDLERQWEKRLEALRDFVENKK